MRKIIVSLLLICLPSLSLGALDLRGAIHVDTFGNDHAVGFSFFAEENITQRIAMRAQADYLRAKAYDVQALVVGRFDMLTLAGGFALEINNGDTIPIAPGAGLLFGWQITRALGLETTMLLSFKPEDLSELHDIRAKILFIYNTENSNTTLSYKADKSFVTSDFVNTLDLQVEAFEEGIPVGLSIGSGVDFLIKSGGFDFDVTMAGGLNVYAGKYGTYFVKTNIEVFSTVENRGIPYEIVVGTRFNL